MTLNLINLTIRTINYVNLKTFNHKMNINKMSKFVVNAHEIVVMRKIVRLTKYFKLYNCKYAQTFRIKIECVI